MASRFWVGGTGTWDASDTTHWAASSNGAGGQSVPTSSDTVTFDASSGGGTVTVNHAALSISTLTCGAHTGTIDFSANNNNITIAGIVSLTGAGTRTLNLGNGTWTLTLATGNVWDNQVVTNQTLNANSSTIDIAATATGTRSFFPGSGKTYNNISVSNPTRNNVPVLFNQAVTFTVANLTLTNVGACRMLAGATATITGAVSFSGTAANPAILFSDSAASTISVANATTLNWLTIQNITKAGAGSIVANNSFDAGGNTGLSFTNPAIRSSFALGM